jgi:N-sulfoglucosamine sulfohydrolase
MTFPLRNLLVAVLVIFAYLTIADNGTAADIKPRQPNFLFIIADDCTHRDIGCYGGQALTPNIDRLATEGMRFTQCFQAAPMCSPTRHNIYSGLYPVKSGAYPNHTFAKAGTKSVVHYLKPHGYRVALSGKKHIAPQEVFPFELSGLKNNPDMGEVDKLFKQSKDAGTPFCLFACSNEPHEPYTMGDPSKYDANRITLPANFVDTPETRNAYVKYLAEISYYDWQVGECLRLLEKHGHADNTLVLVVSEQGSSFPFAKWTCYDAGLQSAMIARWPGKIAAGTTSNAMVEYVDVLPTFLHAAGVKRPDILDGRSFLPVLTGKETQHKQFVFGLMTTRGILNGSDHFGIRSVRSGKYKYIVNLTPEVPFSNVAMKDAPFKSWQAKAAAGDAAAAEIVRRFQHRPAEELYDVTTDTLEWKNLANDPKLAGTKAKLKNQLTMWMTAQGDKGAETEMEAHEHQARNRMKKPGTPKKNGNQSRRRQKAKTK